MAAFGVTNKVSMIVATIGTGIGQGIMPLLGYCCGAGKWERFKECLKDALLFGLGICAALAALCFVFARPLEEIFLTDANAIEYGIGFLRIAMSTAWTFGVYNVLLNSLQATGAIQCRQFFSTPRKRGREALESGLIFYPLHTERRSDNGKEENQRRINRML